MPLGSRRNSSPDVCVDKGLSLASNFIYIYTRHVLCVSEQFMFCVCAWFPAVFLIMLPLFAVSSILAFLLLREMQKEEKKSAKKGNKGALLLLGMV